MSNVANQLRVGDRIEILPAEGAWIAAGEYEVQEIDEILRVQRVRRMDSGCDAWINVAQAERRGQEVRIVSEPRTDNAAARPQQGG